MAEVTTCLGLLRHQPREAVKPLIWAAIVGVALAIGFWWFVALTKPVNPALTMDRDAVSVVALPGGGAMLKLHYLSKPSSYCARQWTEIMQRGENEFFTLATGMSGRGLGTGSEDYYVYRYLPPGLASGPWRLSMRVRHECEPLGLVHWVSASPPVTVIVP